MSAYRPLLLAPARPREAATPAIPAIPPPSSSKSSANSRNSSEPEPPPSYAAPDLPPPTRLPLGWSAADWRDELEERAAIREHCGGLSRDDAEAFALGDLVGEMLAASDPPLNAELRRGVILALGLAG